MIKSVSNYAISQPFDIEARVVYAIPRFHRVHTGTMKQWEILFAMTGCQPCA